LCRCIGRRGWSLVECLAPPRGEYEVTIKLSRGRVLVLNSEGFFLRSRHLPGNTPFLETIETPVNREFLDKIARLNPEDLLCLVVESLENAAKHGSVYASSLVKECRNLVEEAKASCSRSS